jgi:arginine decarboxylase
VDSVLRFVHFEPQELTDAYRAKVEAAAGLSGKQRDDFLAELTAGIEGYTYLE